MKYLDANIFIYANFKPKKGKILSDKIQWCKQEAKKIVNVAEQLNVRFMHFNYIPTGRAKSLMKLDLTPKERLDILQFIGNKIVKLYFESKEKEEADRVIAASQYKQREVEARRFLLGQEQEPEEVMQTFDPEDVDTPAFLRKQAQNEEETSAQ